MVVQGDPIYSSYYNGFQELLSSVLPTDLEFEKFEIRNAEIVFICKNKEFLLESVSSGIGTIISIAWRLYHLQYTHINKPVTIIIDEIENHLHPKMQRTILSQFGKAFPQARFIVTTHSPLIINSVEDSSIYALRKNEDGLIDSERLDFSNKANTAIDILNDVLGVPVTFPSWVEASIQDIVAKYSRENADSISFTDLREELKELGLESLIPSIITNIVDNIDD
ncbi:AAA family ATPase [Aliivibrio wodanis]|uniref:AAA family ATPase n=1 Tax=Aliivibrio wodanis TaxID=80852 RepID=UPI00406BF5C1